MKPLLILLLLVGCKPSPEPERTYDHGQAFVDEQIFKDSLESLKDSIEYNIEK